MSMGSSWSKGIDRGVFFSPLNIKKSSRLYFKGEDQGCAKKPENRINRENREKINRKNRTEKKPIKPIRIVRKNPGSVRFSIL